MKRYLFGAVALAWFLYMYLGMLGSAAAAPVVDGPVSFDLTRVRVSEVAHLMFRDVLRSPYVLAPEVVNDERLISFRFDASKKSHADVVRLLQSVGLDVTTRGDLDVITLSKDLEPAKEVFVYRPKYRDTSYLSELLRPLFKGQFTINRTIAAPVAGKQSDAASPPGSAAALVDRNSDSLVFSGTANEVRQLEKLLVQVDDRPGEVMVRGVVYEVSSSDTDGSAFSLALNLLGGKLTGGLGSSNALDNFVRFKNQTIDAVYSVLSSDSRFKVVSTPSLRVRSGGSGRFTVGQDVPVLGAVTYPGNGQPPVQSVEYRSSGVIFDLQPEVREAVVNLNVSQQVSNFVATDTGVNNSPTLIKREVKTALTLADGDIVVLGGLAENKESAGRSGLSFIPSWLHSKTNESSKTEILLVLQLTKI